MASIGFEEKLWQAAAAHVVNNLEELKQSYTR